MHLKSHFRLAKCLFDLKWYKEAKECIDIFARRFPDYAKSHACENLIKEINNELKKLKLNENSDKNKTKSNQKRTKLSHEAADRNDEEMSENEKESDGNEEEHESAHSHSSESENESERQQYDKKLLKEYNQLKENAIDFKKRYCGHCNVATDIKEANYLGE